MIYFPNNRREVVRGETMATQHDEADEQLDRFEARAVRAEHWNYIRTGFFLLGLGLLIWSVFSVAAAVREHAAVVGLHNEVK